MMDAIDVKQPKGLSQRLLQQDAISGFDRACERRQRRSSFWRAAITVTTMQDDVVTLSNCHGILVTVTLLEVTA